MRLLNIAAFFISTAVPINCATEAPTQLPSEQEVATFIGNTIDWYRQLPASQQIASGPADLFFVEDNRPTAMEIVRLSFCFGKAVAAIQPQPGIPRHPGARSVTPADRELPFLLSMQSKLGAGAQHFSDELQSLERARLTARGADRKTLDVEISETRTRIEILNTISASYENLADFVRAASADPNPGVNLAALVESLERTIPEVSAGGSAAKPSNVAAGQPYDGMAGKILRVLALSRLEHSIETALERTNALMRDLQKLRNPFRDAFLKQLGSLSEDEQSLNALREQESLLSGMVTQFETIAPAVAPLMKQETLLNVYRSHLADWRSEVQTEYRTAWKALLIGLGILTATIGALSGVHVVARRAMSTRVRDHDTRQALLVGQRVLFWVVIIAVVLYAFGLNTGSVATFLGLASAGFALGFRDVLLAIGGRTVLARRLPAGVGERIEIAGVRGEVTKLGLMEFALKETDADGHPTGREVFFSNSYVFLSPATPLFRESPAPEVSVLAGAPRVR